MALKLVKSGDKTLTLDSSQKEKVEVLGFGTIVKHLDVDTACKRLLSTCDSSSPSPRARQHEGWQDCPRFYDPHRERQHKFQFLV